MCNGQTEELFENGVVCLKCESISVIELPTEEELTKFYQTYNDVYTGGGSGKGGNQSRYSQAYLRLVEKYVKPLNAPELLDIGCSTNPFPNDALKAGFSVTAMDFNRPIHLDEKVEFIHGGLNKNWLSSEKTFDVITSWAVIEHVASPHFAFKLISTLVKPGGHIFLTTPEIGTSLTRNSLGKSPWFYPPEHLFIISPKAIRLLANDNDIDLVEHGHFEVNKTRYVLRYGLGLAESVIGKIVSIFSKTLFDNLKQKRKQRFAGIHYFVLQRR